MQYEYTPKQCSGDGNFEGKVTLKGLHFEKKMDMLEKLEKQGMSFSELTNMEDSASNDPMKAMKIMKGFVVETKGCWIDCSIKDKKLGLEMKSYDDVASYGPAQPILMDVAMHILAGTMGN